MKITLSDSNKQAGRKRGYSDFLDEDYRMLLWGESNCGKTNILMHMLRKPLVYYDKIISSKSSPREVTRFGVYCWL